MAAPTFWESYGRYIAGALFTAVAALAGWGIGISKASAVQDQKIADTSKAVETLQKETVKRQEMDDLKKKVDEVNQSVKDLNLRLIENGYARKR